MKILIYHLMRVFGPLLPNSLYTNLLFLFNCIRLKRPFYVLDIKHPKTLNEKINFIKYFERNPLAPIVADKIIVRDYVEKKIGTKYLVPLVAVFDRPEQIDFSILPQQFVMKLNNGSGFNLICTDKSKLDQKQIIRNFSKAYHKDIYVASREWQYKEIKPRILVEKMLGANIYDYKIFCEQKSGPIFIQVDADRFHAHKRNIYDLNWNMKEMDYVYPKSKNKIQKPKQLKKMFDLAKNLSQEFSLSRIDFYVVNDKIFFGEITLHPEGGVGPFDSYRSDLEIGQLIKL
jgi:hypothetical protein